MIIGCRFICVFAVLINTVSLQVSVKAVIGGSVVLPCSFTEHGLKAQDTDALWRHSGSKYGKYVYEIITGEDSVERQDPRFKNRVETFPLEYERGNFSIKLNNLTHGDAGKYTCYITPSYESQTVQLLIKESTAEKEEEMGLDHVGKSFDLNWPLLLLPVLLPIICSIIFYFRQKNQARLISVTVTQMTVRA